MNACDTSTSRVVSVLVAGTRVTLTAVAEGTATIRVTTSGLTAPDVHGGGRGRPFTDELIHPGVTPVRAVHFTESRMRIDGLRTVAGLGRFSETTRS